MKQLKYPQTRTVNTVESHAGIEFPDPYRWLEDNTKEVKQWQIEQGQLASNYVHDWPFFAALKEKVNYFSVDRINVLPRFINGKWFRINRVEGAMQSCVIMSHEPYGDGDTIFRCSDDDLKQIPFLSWISPSPNGEVLAVGLCTDGSESNTIKLIDIYSRKELANPPPQLLMDAWTGGVCWLPDSSGFYFLALLGDPENFKQEILFHNLDDGSQKSANIPIPNPDSKDYTLVAPSPQGRYMVANHGMINPLPVAIQDLDAQTPVWRPFITDLTGTIAGFVLDDHLIALTNINAPCGRVVAIPLDAEDPNNPSVWTELVPESKTVIRSVTHVGNYLYLTEFVDTYARVRITDLDGTPVGEVSLPGKGAVVEPAFPLMNMIPKGHPNEYLFSFSSLIESWGVYCHRPNETDVETLQSPHVRIENAVVEDHWASSTNDIKIPYHSLRLKDINLSQRRPTLIYAYGGYNMPLLPEFPTAKAAFVAAGGIYVHAHIRGGAEFGQDWWEGGRMQSKQNCYKDLYAVAEDLIHKGYTTPQQLAMTGGSNGGLLAGVALTQRPDLWRVVIPQVPVLDLMGALRHHYGRYAIEIEYGDPNEPTEIKRMAEFSAYHLIKDKTEYPSVFISAGNTDPRCPPWHARKFAARLQAANAADTPVLVHIWENAGHGQATAKDIQVLQTTEWLAFLLQQLNMKL